MNVDYYKELFNMLLNEINVKNFRVKVGNTERGELSINFNGKVFEWFMNDENIGQANEKVALEISKLILSKHD